MSSVRPLTLLSVHAHPDDETITMGGTLARYSAAGVRTIVVTCTTGDLGEVRDPALVGQDVASLRAAELACASGVLGVSRLIQLGYGDSGMAGTPDNDRPSSFCNVPLANAAARLVDILAEERPDVMVCYDETGGYGHPDHVRSHEVAMAAYESAAPAIRPQRLYFVRFPLRWSRAFVAALRAAGIEAPGSAPAGADAGPSVTEIGVPDELVTATFDVRAFVTVKLRALACHASQIPPDHFLRRMPLALAERLWAQEFYSLERDTAAAPAPRAESGTSAGSDRLAGGSERLVGRPERLVAEPERLAAESERHAAGSECPVGEPERLIAEPERLVAEPERLVPASDLFEGLL